MKQGKHKVQKSVKVFAMMATLMVGIAPVQKDADILANYKEGLETKQEGLNSGDIGVSTYNEESYIERDYVLATDDDFSGTRNGSFRYIGTDEYVEIPHTIKGVNVTSYSNLFVNTSVKGVKSTNKNVTNMGSMFSGATSEELDVSELDTSSVTTMSSMFRNAKAKKLDLSNFDTSKVTSMSNMFYGASTTDINVSSFDTSNVTNTSSMFRDTSVEVLDLRSFDTSNMSTSSSQNTANMFNGSKLTLGYARTKADAVWMNNITNNPRDLEFTIYKLAEDKDFEGEFDGNFKYVGKDSYIEIPHTIKGVNVTSYKGMFEGTSIRGVKSTNENITDMGGMFKNTISEELDLTNLDTSKVISMGNMFEGTKATVVYTQNKEETERLSNKTNKIEGLKVTHFVMAKDNDFSGTSNGSFRYVGGDYYVEIPHEIKGVNVTSYSNLFVNTSVKGVKSTNKNVTNMGSMLSGTTSEDLDVSELDTSSVTSMSSMFRNAKAKKLDLSNFDTSKVTSMSSMFYGTSATEINVSSFDTSNVTRTSDMFRDTSVEVLDLRSFDTSNMSTSVSQYTGYMFNGSKLTLGYARTKADAVWLGDNAGNPRDLEFTIYKLAEDKDFEGESDGNFKYIGKDSYIEIPHTIKGVNVTSYKDMFEGTSIRGVKSTNPNVKDMSGMFKGTSATELDLTNLEVSQVGNTENMFEGTRASVVYTRNREEVKTIDKSTNKPIDLKVTHFVMAKDSDFRGTSNSNFRYVGGDVYVEIPHEIKGVNVTSYSSMFTNTEVEGVKSTNKNVTNMNSMFYGVTSEELDISELDTISVTSMSSMFRDTKAKKLDLSNFDTSKVTIMSSMFYGTSATEINVSSFDTSNVTRTSDMFRDTSVEVLDLRSFDTSNMSTSVSQYTGYMFNGSKATLGYARTKADAVWLGDNAGNPRDLEFTIYKLAEDKDFEGESDGNFRYIGKDSYIEIPHTIKGVNVTSYKDMFEGTSIRGVKSTNPNVKDMSGMFKGTSATELDLTTLDTSNVIHTDNMFEGARATIGYSKTPEDTIILNKSTNRPKDLEFTHFVMAKDSDFRGTSNSNFRYVGGDAYVEIPHEIKGVNVTSYSSMFTNASVKGVKSTNTNITSMTSMFSGATSEDLDVSELDTSSVTTMSSMFRDTKAKKLDLSNFDTSKVTRMSSMFYGTSATEINVSSFDTSNVMYTSEMFRDTSVEVLDLRSFDLSNVLGRSSYDYDMMFYGSKATLGYARTKAEAIWMNNISRNPKGLEFTVYVLAKDGDFEGDLDGNFRYIGKDSYIEIPHVIKGVNVTSYKEMFEGTSVKGVKSTNPNVKDMSGMFKNTNSPIIDLTMVDTLNVTKMDNMFRGSKATIGYSRTPKDADKLNMSSNRPGKLEFTPYVLATDSDFSGTSNGSFRYVGGDVYVEIPHEIKGVNVTSYSSMFTNTEVEGVKSTNKNVTNMASMFYNHKADVLIVKELDTSNVTTMSSMFNGSTAKIIDIRGIDTSNVTTMTRMFMNTVAKDLDFSNFNTSQVSNMSYMFADTGVGKLDLRSFNTESVTNMSYMFNNSGATEIDLSSFNTSRVSNMEDMFRDSSVEKLDLRSFDISNLSTYNRISNMFRDTKATIGYTRTQDIADRFNRTNKPDELVFTPYVLAEDEDFTGNSDGDFKYIGDYEFVEVPHVIKGINVTSYSGMFEGSPVEGVKSTNTNVTDMGNMFKKSTSESLELREMDTSGVTNMSQMFTGTNAKTINMENFNTSNVKDMGQMFKNTSLESINVLSFNTVNVENMEEMFENIKVETIDISTFDTSKVVQLNNMFKGATATLGYARTPEDVEKLNRSLGKPEELEFDIYRVTVTSNNIDWTRNNVRLSTELIPQVYSIELPDGTEVTEEGVEVGEKINFEATDNGTYTFKVNYKEGFSIDVEYEVTNIDRVMPTLTVTGIPEDYTEDEYITLTLTAKDEHSGVSRITFPDGNYTNTQETTTYRIRDNGEYEFRVRDNVGNVHTEVVTVDVMMIPFTLYVKDKDGEIIEGARYELLRDGEVYRETTSNSTGLANFGRIPQEGEYLVRQVTTPDGYKLSNPVEVSIGDPVDKMGVDIPITEELDMPTTTLNTKEWTNKDVEIEVVYDETSDIKQYKIGTGNWQRNRGKVTVSSNTVIYTRSYDAKGSWSPIGEVTINNIDKVRPTMEIEQDNREWVADEVMLTVQTSDKHSGIEELTSGEGLELVGTVELEDGVENTYKVEASGVYRFISKDKAGNTTLETHIVTNIDRTPPRVNVKGNPNYWNREYEVDLTIEVIDTGSGVEKVTLPDGVTLYGEDAKEFTYTVTENGEYEFLAEDKVGNKITHTESVTKLEKEYSIHVEDTEQRGLEGIEFELYRDDELLGTYVSDSEGKVDFGKVYISGKYELKQNGVLEGYRLNNQIIEVDVTDDNFKVINYLKTQEMPGTGTLSMLVVGIALTLGVSGLYVINRRKKGLNQ